jgi:hypothetical protein
MPLGAHDCKWPDAEGWARSPEADGGEAGRVPLAASSCQTSNLSWCDMLPTTDTTTNRTLIRENLMFALRLIAFAFLAWVAGWIAGLVLCIPIWIVQLPSSDAAMSRAWKNSKAISFEILPILGIAFGVIGAIKYELDQAAESQRKRAAEEEAERNRQEAERQKYTAQQTQLRGQIVEMNRESLTAFEQLPFQLRSAEENLDKAERDFARRAFIPFWESVEKAAFSLGGFEERVRKIERTSSQYIDVAREARKYEITPPPAFAVSPYSAPRLRIATETSRRMSEIVDKAQCGDVAFSQIYLQIRTNQILVAGFRNLAQALDEMSWRITQSIDDLSTSVNAMGAQLEASLRNIHVQGERVANAAEGLRSDAAVSSAREQKVLEMLDNIQRKRYPSFVHGGLR